MFVILQDADSPTESAINKLFGVQLHTKLTCGESGESIEVNHSARDCNTMTELVCTHSPAMSRFE